MVHKFIKKPVQIEAVQWDGKNIEEIKAFCEGNMSFTSVCDAGSDPVYNLTIETMEGPLHATVTDWIIKGIKGEFYPCKADIFEQSYIGVE